MWLTNPSQPSVGTERARNSLLVAGIIIMILGPLSSGTLISEVQRLLVVTGINPDPVCMLGCTVYTFFGLALFGLGLVLSALMWWLIEKSRVERIRR